MDLQTASDPGDDVASLAARLDGLETRLAEVESEVAGLNYRLQLISTGIAGILRAFDLDMTPLLRAGRNTAPETPQAGQSDELPF